MAKAILFDANDVVRLDSPEQSCTRELLFASECARGFRIVRMELEAPSLLEAHSRGERILVGLAGAAALVNRCDPGANALLRTGECMVWNEAGMVSIEGAAALLAVSSSDPDRSLQVCAPRLGARTLRDVLGGDCACVYNHVGRVLVRVTDEEEPFALRAGEGLWLSELEASMEWEITGTDHTGPVVLAQLVPARV